jgi:hypothetical protein
MVNLTGNRNGTTLTPTAEGYKVVYIARDKADTRDGMDQCSEISKKMRDSGRFDTYVTQAQRNYLVFWGKRM